MIERDSGGYAARKTTKPSSTTSSAAPGKEAAK
jgi:hypothetical protein